MDIFICKFTLHNYKAEMLPCSKGTISLCVWFSLQSDTTNFVRRRPWCIINQAQQTHQHHRRLTFNTPSRDFRPAAAACLSSAASSKLYILMIARNTEHLKINSIFFVFLFIFLLYFCVLFFNFIPRQYPRQPEKKKRNITQKQTKINNSQGPQTHPVNDENQVEKRRDIKKEWRNTLKMTIPFPDWTITMIIHSYCAEEAAATDMLLLLLLLLLLPLLLQTLSLSSLVSLDLQKLQTSRTKTSKK